jgi:hypothetical protein
MSIIDLDNNSDNNMDIENTQQAQFESPSDLMLNFE